MRNFILILGAVLIIFGLVSLAYNGFSYKTKENVAELKLPQVGQFQVTETKQNTIWIPPLVSGLSIGVGVILVITSRVNKK